MILMPYALGNAFSLIYWPFINQFKHEIYQIFAIIFLNVDISTNVDPRLFKFGVLILDIIMEGTRSQMFYLGPSSYFM